MNTPGVPDGKIVSLMRWVDGRKLSQGLQPAHFRALGRVIARLHKFSAIWQPPEGFEQPVWDWEGQLGGRYFKDPVVQVEHEKWRNREGGKLLRYLQHC